MAQESFDFCIGHRFGKVKTLKNIAATALQEIHLERSFHAFGDQNEQA